MGITGIGGCFLLRKYKAVYCHCCTEGISTSTFAREKSISDGLKILNALVEKQRRNKKYSVLAINFQNLVCAMNHDLGNFTVFGNNFNFRSVDLLEHDLSSTSNS